MMFTFEYYDIISKRINDDLVYGMKSLDCIISSIYAIAASCQIDLAIRIVTTTLEFLDQLGSNKQIATPKLNHLHTLYH